MLMTKQLEGLIVQVKEVKKLNVNLTRLIDLILPTYTKVGTMIKDEIKKLDGIVNDKSIPLKILSATVMESRVDLFTEMMDQLSGIVDQLEGITPDDKSRMIQVLSNIEHFRTMYGLANYPQLTAYSSELMKGGRRTKHKRFKKCKTRKGTI
jgi:hypothetical protein